MRSLRHQRQSGFTLIELVIVIVIIGILAAIALPRFFDMTGDAQIAAASGAQQAVGTGIAVATAIKKSAPTGAEVAAVVSGAACDGADIKVTGTGTAFVTVPLVTTAGAAATACATDLIGGVGIATYTP